MSTSKIYIGQTLAIDAVENISYTKAETDQKIADLVDSAPETLDTLNELAAAIGDDPSFFQTFDTHVSDINNPHSVTPAQLNLDNVDNTSDADKPISTATQNALDTKPSSSDFDNIVKITQGDYDLITPDPNTLYIITL